MHSILDYPDGEVAALFILSKQMIRTRPIAPCLLLHSLFYCCARYAPLQSHLDRGAGQDAEYWCCLPPSSAVSSCILCSNDERRKMQEQGNEPSAEDQGQ